MSTTAESVRPVPLPRARRSGRALIVAGAAGAAILVWLVARLLGTPFEVRMPGQQPTVIGLWMVLVTATLAALAGWVALAVLERLTRHPRTTWTVLAILALAASFIPLTQAELGGDTRVALGLMHLAVAAVLIPGMRRTTHRPIRRTRS